jgi:nicotinamide riboside kinase
MPGVATRTRCLYIIGAQCTGKTTLVNALEEEFCRNDATHSQQEVPSKPVVIREVARAVLKEKQLSRDDITNSPSRALELQKHILEAQLVAEKAAIDVKNPTAWYISDRSGMDPIVYAQLFVGGKEADEMLASETWKELEHRMKAGVVMLCEAGCSWLTDDGTRLMPPNLGQWMSIDSAFREQLAKRDIRYMVVPKDLLDIKARVKLVQEQLAR